MQPIRVFWVISVFGTLFDPVGQARSQLPVAEYHSHPSHATPCSYSTPETELRTAGVDKRRGGIPCAQHQVCLTIR